MPRKKRRKKTKAPKKQISERQTCLGESNPSGENRKRGAHQFFPKVFLYILPAFFMLIILVWIFIFSKPKFKVIPDSNLNILLITMDTTRADRIGCYGYAKGKTPNLDYLASKGVRFANSYSPVPLTLPSHCSIMTGTYPIYHRVHNNGFYYLAPDNITLAEILKKKGFKTAAFVSSFTVDSRFGLDQGFDLYEDNFLQERVIKNFSSERKAVKVYAVFANWFEKNYKKQFFCWIHFFDPHLPYNPPSPFREELAGRPYDGEIAYMDFYIGKVIAKLKEKNLLDKTLVVLAGDHGEALGEKNEVDHGLYIYNVTLKVPLIIYAPYHLPSKRIIKSNVRLIDIMPTILDMVKIKIKSDIQGISLLPYIQGRKKDDLASYIETYLPREFYGWSQLVGIVDGPWKYIQAPKPELYNLVQDPGENENLYSEKIKIADTLKQKLTKIISQFSSLKEAKKRSLTSEEQARLRSLGYLGGELPSGESSPKLPDPKDKILEYSLFAYAKKYEYQQDYQKAEKNYKELLRLNPNSPWYYVYLAHLYERMDKMKEALQVLEKGRKAMPDSIIILAQLSLFYLKITEPQKALEASQAVLQIDPKYFDALYVSAIALLNLGRWQEALSYFEKALSIEPENKHLRLQYAYCLSTLDKGEEALQVYLNLKKDYPQEPVVYRELGILYDSLGELKKAEENFKKCVRLNPSANSYFNYAVILEKIGKLKEAVHYLKLYLQTSREGNTERKKRAQQALAQWERRLTQH